MKLIIINGPNINLLGTREPGIYGNENYAALEKIIRKTCAAENIEVDIMQSNHEGVIIDTIQSTAGKYDGIIINPAAFTHTSIAILDALKAVGITTVEVHISDISQRESFRQISYAGMACVKTIAGQGIDGYRQAILFLKEYL
ncbi:MAG: type II 3-dehydroquinate dehydratase [Defluviitaleaceae bacterium]|nr:type II 3-dehydroquinate dehydratase [Defluviitaleaceae bacterium]